MANFIGFSRVWRRIPTGIWALGFVSLLMDISSEIIHALLPVYLVSVLGVSALSIGFLEGIAVATATFTKVFSGGLSDWLGKRKVLLVCGYGLAAVTKPVFPLAPTVEWIVGARIVDRLGKGIRGAPRDALIADISPADLRGASYGLRKSLDTFGAFLGPLMAIWLMALFAGSFTTVFWIATLPAFLAVGLLIFAVQDPDPEKSGPKRARPIRKEDLLQLSPAYWSALGLALVIALARFSEAFLVLRGQASGLSLIQIPLVFVVMNAAQFLSAYPAGSLSDRLGRKGLILVGLGLLLLADLVLAFGEGQALLFVGVALWGLHLGFTGGILDALIADHAPEHLRGSAFGLFHLTMGTGFLVASITAGLMWDLAGPSGTFLIGAILTGLALIGLVGLRRRRR